MFDWVRLIVMRNVPLTAIEDEIYREVMRGGEEVLSIKTVRKVILAMKRLVIDEIAKDMKDAGFGTIMHDGWTKFSQHYVGLFAYFNKKIKRKFGSVDNLKKIEFVLPFGVEDKGFKIETGTDLIWVTPASKGLVLDLERSW